MPLYTHELPVEQIKTLKIAKSHLCDLAVQHGKFMPEMCQTCESACTYGKKALELIGLPRIAHDRVSLSEKLLSKHDILPTIKQRMILRRK